MMARQAIRRCHVHGRGCGLQRGTWRARQAVLLQVPQLDERAGTVGSCWRIGDAPGWSAPVDGGRRDDAQKAGRSPDRGPQRQLHTERRGDSMQSDAAGGVGNLELTIRARRGRPVVP